MQRKDECSIFRSAIEWPDMRPVIEEATGELKQISPFVASALEILASAVSIAPHCESPIEIDLGARLSSNTIRLIDDPRLLLVPQYVIRPYRYDFAIARDGKLIALIECDGKDFHSTQDQLANDRSKNNLAAKEGVFLFRFSGSEIFQDGKDCVRRILWAMRLRGHLTQQQWQVVETSLAPRQSGF